VSPSGGDRIAHYDVNVLIGEGGMGAITPDGERVLYRVGIGGPPQMVVRSLAELEATPLVQGSRHMFVSPDGNSVGYFAGGLFRVPIHIAQAFEVFL
jgi:hypothetical protein